MKTPKLLCSIAALALVQGQTFAVETDAVGFTTTTAATNSDLSVALPLNRAPVLQTTVAGVVGNVITLNTALTANQFTYVSPTQPNHYYVSVRSTVSPTSPVKGKWFTILSNVAGASGASSISVDSDGPTSVQAQGLAQNDVLEFIPFWTLNTLFPNGQGLTITTDIDSPQDLISLLPQDIPGINQQASQTFLYSNDTANLPAAGWYASGTFTDQSPQGVKWADLPLAPDTFIRFRNRGAPQSLTITGAVPTSDKTTTIARLANNQKQDNFATNPYPIPVSLPDTKLVESGAFEVTTDVDSPKDLLLVYDGTETGLNALPSKTYLYVNDPANLPTPGWYSSGTFNGPYGVNDKLVPAGASLIVRKASGSIVSLPWTFSKPY